MNANKLGKTLVFLHVIVSVVALTWAGAVFAQLTDWGWKEPRKELDYRIPSEYDIRAARLAQAQRVRDLNYVEVKQFQANLRESEEAFAKNHLWYREEFARLNSDPEPIEVKELKFVDGVLELDTPNKPLGKPVLENPLKEIKKSYSAYVHDVNKLNFWSTLVNLETKSWVELNEEITNTLNGFDKGKKTKAGLYDLINDEAKSLALLKFEIEYLTPIMVNNRKNAELYGERKVRLLKALDRAIMAKPK